METYLNPTFTAFSCSLQNGCLRTDVLHHKQTLPHSQLAAPKSHPQTAAPPCSDTRCPPRKSCLRTYPVKQAPCVTVGGETATAFSTTACRRHELVAPSCRRGFLSSCPLGSFPKRFSGAFIKADLNIFGKMMVFIVPLGNFPLLSASAVIISDCFFRVPLCPDLSISEYLICQTAKIKKKKKSISVYKARK